MILDQILFFSLAVIMLASAVGMLMSRSAIYSALFLILLMSALAVLYLILGAPFIAMAQITVYAGAIMVLFLFVIMLLGAERLGQEGNLPWQRPISLLLGLVLLIESGYVLFFHNIQFSQPGNVDTRFGSPTLVGETLFSQYLLPFEITSVLLLVAIVGAVVLTRRRM